MSHALNNCINCLPGQRDVDEALRSIAESSKRLLSNQVAMLFICVTREVLHANRYSSVCGNKVSEEFNNRCKY